MCMSRYKVAQDVEAEDKILGPFTFRQFIYLIVVAIAMALAWGLAQIFILLAIIPLPIILLFGALALPLRKDQPMEVYLAAVVSFYTKPRKRMWQPDGLQSLIEIVAPTVTEVERVKNLSQDEAERRLAYLARLADTQGWSIRHTRIPDSQNAMISDVYFEAQRMPDMFDENTSEARAIDRRIEQSNQARRRAAIERMQSRPAALPAAAPIPPPQPTPPPTIEPTSQTSSPYQAHTDSAEPPLATSPIPTVRSSPQITKEPEDNSSLSSTRSQPEPPLTPTNTPDVPRSLPMALPAVIPHDSVLPDALARPYTPTQTTPPPNQPTLTNSSTVPDSTPVQPVVLQTSSHTNIQPSSSMTPPIELTPTPAPVAYRQHSSLADDDNIIDMGVRYNPYPSIHQSVIQPLDRQYYAVTTPTREERQAQATKQFTSDNNSTATTSTKPVSPDIIKLASNSDLSVATIANEARRIHNKNKSSGDDEIVVSLR